jgi:hypothetical protein
MANPSRTLRAEDLGEDAAYRFWSRVRLTPSGCMEFDGADLNNQGYGRFCVRVGTRRHWRPLAHRAAYALTWGECPADKFLLHKCDNRACVNPTHLELGDQLSNMKDMIDKGRAWWMVPEIRERRNAAWRATTAAKKRAV